MLTAIDLFSGCGGFSSGFIKAGYEITDAVEYDPEIAGTYMLNHPNTRMMIDDIQNVVSKNIFHTHDADVIIGGPPCQGFSMAGARIRKGHADDPRNYLFKHYLDIVRQVNPFVFVIENVKGMVNIKGGNVFHEMKSMLENPKNFNGEKYHINYMLVNALEFGIPQKRERLILLGTKKQMDFEKEWQNAKLKIKNKIPTFFEFVNIRDAISNLPDATKDGIVKNPEPITAYQHYLAINTENIHNHSMSNHSPLAVSRMDKIETGKNYTSLKEQINSVHSGSYGRLDWNGPATTITTRFDTPSGGRFIHPDKNRTLTFREAARIQSFSDNFVFIGNRRCISRQIGNAIPPKISFFLAELIKFTLE